MGVSDHPVESPAQAARASTGRRAHPPKRGGSWGELPAVYCFLGKIAIQRGAAEPDGGTGLQTRILYHATNPYSVLRFTIKDVPTAVHSRLAGYILHVFCVRGTSSQNVMGYALQLCCRVCTYQMVFLAGTDLYN
jgi:hypothetical protein